MSFPSEGLRVRLWGVRGSINASGFEFMDFGGHTACVEVWCGDRLFVVDAGTGLIALGGALGAQAPSEVDILLSHVHLDHVTGLPFFKPALLEKDRVIRTHCGNLGGESAAAALNKLYSPPLFPITLEQLPSRFEHFGFHAGETLDFGPGLRVRTHALEHPGGSTGFRFDYEGRSLCYLSDLEHGPIWPDPALVDFVSGADLVLYDGMFSEADYPRCQGWGHSTWEKGAELCGAAGVGAMGILHLYPGDDDTKLRALEREIQSVMPSGFVARAGQTFSYPARPAVAPVAAVSNAVKVPVD